MKPKERLVVLQCVDCTADETQELLNHLRDSDIPYRFIITNREVKSMDFDQFKALCKKVLEK